MVRVLSATLHERACSVVAPYVGGCAQYNEVHFRLQTNGVLCYGRALLAMAHKRNGCMHTQQQRQRQRRAFMDEVSLAC